jgi:hypothetical protein
MIILRLLLGIDLLTILLLHQQLTIVSSLLNYIKLTMNHCVDLHLIILIIIFQSWKELSC